jgi:hypothetical protein
MLAGSMLQSASPSQYARSRCSPKPANALAQPVSLRRVLKPPLARADTHLHTALNGCSTLSIHWIASSLRLSRASPALTWEVESPFEGRCVVARDVGDVEADVVVTR